MANFFFGVVFSFVITTLSIAAIEGKADRIMIEKGVYARDGIVYSVKPGVIQ